MADYNDEDYRDLLQNSGGFAPNATAPEPQPQEQPFNMMPDLGGMRDQAQTAAPQEQTGGGYGEAPLVPSGQSAEQVAAPEEAPGRMVSVAGYGLIRVPEEHYERVMAQSPARIAQAKAEEEARNPPTMEQMIQKQLAQLNQQFQQVAPSQQDRLMEQQITSSMSRLTQRALTDPREMTHLAPVLKAMQGQLDYYRGKRTQADAVRAQILDINRMSQAAKAQQELKHTMEFHAKGAQGNLATVELADGTKVNGMYDKNGNFKEIKGQGTPTPMSVEFGDGTVLHGYMEGGKFKEGKPEAGAAKGKAAGTAKGKGPHDSDTFDEEAARAQAADFLSKHRYGNKLRGPDGKLENLTEWQAMKPKEQGEEIDAFVKEAEDRHNRRNKLGKYNPDEQAKAEAAKTQQEKAAVEAKFGKPEGPAEPFKFPGKLGEVSKKDYDALQPKQREYVDTIHALRSRIAQAYNEHSSVTEPISERMYSLADAAQMALEKFGDPRRMPPEWRKYYQDALDNLNVLLPKMKYRKPTPIGTSYKDLRVRDPEPRPVETAVP